MIKEDVRKNRQRIRNSLKTRLSNVSTDTSTQIAHTPKQKFPPLIYNKIHKRTSEQIRHFDELLYLKETHIVHSLENMFEKLQKIGQGAHSAVYKCRQIKTGKIFVVKIFKNVDMDQLRHFKDHFLIKRVVDHQNIIKAHYLFINQKLKRVHMICEYCPFKNLRQFMKNHKKIDENTIKSIIYGILCGIQFLHRHGICHRDLKPDNILYSHKTGQLKIIDFEIAKMTKYIDQPLQMWTNTGTLYYKAPQMFHGSYNQDIDLWALGVIAYELVYRKLPFDNVYVSETIADICQKQPDYDQVGVSPFLIQFIKGCLTKDPTKRMKCYEAIHSPFLLSRDEECSPVQPKRQSLKNHHNQFMEDCECDCDDDKQNYHSRINNPRRSHSSNQALNQKNIFSRDLGIRFLQK